MLRSVLYKVWINAEYLSLGEGQTFEAEAALIPGTGCWGNYENKGFFHTWGTSYITTINGLHVYTIAIVENESGEIIEVLPQNLKFIT